MRCKSRLLLASILVVSYFLSPLGNRARGDDIQWRLDFATAVRESAAKNRPLFMDVYMVPCHGCTTLEATTLHDPALVKLINEQFIPVKVDGTKNDVTVQ